MGVEKGVGNGGIHQVQTATSAHGIAPWQAGRARLLRRRRRSALPDLLERFSLLDFQIYVVRSHLRNGPWAAFVHFSCSGARRSAERCSKRKSIRSRRAKVAGKLCRNRCRIKLRWADSVGHDRQHVLKIKVSRGDTGNRLLLSLSDCAARTSDFVGNAFDVGQHRPVLFREHLVRQALQCVTCDGSVFVRTEY
jgi:hypothetical protein